MKIDDWCIQNSITNANYYYWLRRAREACLESISNEILSTSIVPVSDEIINPKSTQITQTGLDITANGFSVHVTETTSLELLATILQVIAHAK